MVTWTHGLWSFGRQHVVIQPVAPRSTGRPASPPAFAPLVEVRPLRTERRVVAVARVEPDVVGQLVENPRPNVVEQGGEVLRRPGAADAAGEQRITLPLKIDRLESGFPEGGDGQGDEAVAEGDASLAARVEYDPLGELSSEHVAQRRQPGEVVCRHGVFRL
jgi:hypothetical protein